ncbi:serine hydrolase [Mucilaginibacter sp. JRF]|uniref:serine hydrolase domain-containing protein n=1 Tax=Mucilaginibacter sp. JRF TaxID=2780088 RepID=UPI00188172D5|nr:serine hydrolase [Mucilaginibacter sp. JRF]MBE9584417.1 serine hydrolase [Mucilaginibacter sp. JRF]
MKQVLIVIILISNCLQLRAQKQPVDAGTLLENMSAAISRNEYPGIHSISVLVADSLIYEQYFNEFSPDSLHDSRSSFKSITALLLGIAIDKGFIKSTDKKVYDFLPEYASLLINDPLRKQLTIQHLLDMQSGFDCEEFNGTKDCEDEMAGSNNWVKFSLERPMKDTPGKVFAYTSCNPVIIGGIISRTTNMSVMSFARQYLFDPLGITDYKWTVDPSGNGMTGGSFYIKPADLLKIGRLVRDEGKWNGNQIVSKKWIKAVNNVGIPIPQFSFAKVSQSSLLIPQQTFYGNYWYREVLETPNLHEELLFASGNGGQYIFVIKRLNAVIVFTQGNYSSWKAKQAFELLGKYIIPALRNSR